jgi:hypothetical protein
MEQADNKFKLLKVHNKWNAPSQDEEKILALEARVKKLTSLSQKNGRNPKGKEPKKGGKALKGAPTVEQPSWFNKEPASSDLHKPKFWKGKEWWWCSPKTGGKCTGQHRRHKPSACEGKAFKFATPYVKTTTDGAKPTENKNEKQKLKLAKALKARAVQPMFEGDSD